MARQKLFLHVGLPKSGSTYLQSVLAQNRLTLREHGYVYPWVRSEAMFHAAVELREAHLTWGLAPELIDDTWARLLRRCRNVGDTAIISHELLAGALPSQIQRIGEDLSDFEVHVVVTVRDVARQASAYWQEQVKNGVPDSFAEFSTETLSTGPLGTGPLSTGPMDLETSLFWSSQDVEDTLRRWEALVPPERLHVVVCPPSSGDPSELWHRFAAAVGLDPTLLDTDVVRSSNQSLGAAQVKLLREVVLALDGRIAQPHYALIVKRLFAQTLLSSISSPPAVTPDYLRVPLADLAQKWSRFIIDRGYPVHGALREMVPSTPVAAEVSDPDDISAEALSESVGEVIAHLLVDLHHAEATTRAQARTIEELTLPVAPYPSAWRRGLSWTKGKASFRDHRTERAARARRDAEFSDPLPPEDPTGQV